MNLPITRFIASWLSWYRLESDLLQRAAGRGVRWSSRTLYLPSTRDWHLVHGAVDIAISIYEEEGTRDERLLLHMLYRLRADLDALWLQGVA